MPSKYASKTLTPEQRSQRARIAALTRWARKSQADRAAVGAKLRDAAFAQYIAEVDAENPGLPDDERARLADAKRTAHLLKIGFQSSREAGNASRESNALIKRIANIAPELTNEQVEQLRAIIARAD